MAVVLNSRFDITLDAVRRVAWRGEAVEIGERCMALIAERRQTFLNLLEHEPEHIVYGVNRGQGEMIHQPMTPAQMDRLARLKPVAAAVSFGEPYPERVVRAVVLARLANVLDGHAVSTPRLAQAFVDMLNDGSMPQVAQSGQGGGGEMLSLYPLFAALSRSFELEPGERGVMINGAPSGAAFLADAAISSRHRLRVAQEVFALAIEAFNAPREHYDARIGELWGGDHDTAAFRDLGELLAGSGMGVAPRPYHAPVSYRVIPSILGQAHWAIGQAEQMAEGYLSAITHNPIYFASDGNNPNGFCMGAGGFQNSMTAPILNALSVTWADLCLLCERLCAGLLNGRVSGYPDFLLSGRGPGESDGHGAVGYLPMAIVGFLEEARVAAQPTFIPACDASIFGQDDVASPALLAWPKEAKAGRCLDRSLAVLAVAASQALHVTERTEVAPKLRELLRLVRGIVPPVVEDRVLGGELRALSDRFAARIYDADEGRAS